MKQFLRTLTVAAALVAPVGMGTAYAQEGQPHSLTVKSLFNQVTLNWQEPTSPIALQWHDGNDYNGVDGVLANPEGSISIYAGAKFSAQDLSNYVGESVDSIAFFRYRPVYQAYILVYENGQEVRNVPVDMSDFTKNTWKKVALPKPYTIKAGAEVTFAVKMVYGRNLDLTAICDRAATVGKGNVYSYDGKTWKSDAPGDFLITAYIKNTATTTPTGYNIYRNDTKVNAEPLASDATTETLTNEPDGNYAYKVAAIYADGEKASYAVNASPKSVYAQVPPVSTLTAKASGLTNTVSWTAPLKRGDEMTWSNKALQVAIGGTASNNTKLWIKQSFSAEDMAAFPNHQITAINAFVGPEGGILSATLWVMKNGVIDYYEPVSEEAVAAIKAGDWNKFKLTKPYVMALGNAYAFGLYYTQTPKKHPAGVDTSAGTNTKGNEFSTSSPRSTGFDKTSPSWKTLASGKITGNFMLTADVEALSEEAKAEQAVASYNVYRNGTLVAEGVTGNEYADNVSDLGNYTYSVVARSADGKTSAPYSASAQVSLPEEYTAPIVISKSQEGKQVKLAWSANAYEMSHYTKAATATGFKEEMALLYGAKFTKEELAPYVGYRFYSMKFGIYAAIGKFSIEVRDSKNNVLLKREYANGDIEPGYLYNTTFDKGESFNIPANTDLYICYNANLPANSTPILLDGGPAVEGGAMISMTDGAKWMKFGTVAAEMDNKNFVIGAMAIANGSDDDASKAKAAQLTPESINTATIERLPIGTVKTGVIETEDEGFGIEPDQPMRAQANAEKPAVKAFRVYCNGKQVYEGTNTSYESTLDKYGVFDYYVTSVYSNGWESPASSVSTFTNLISQKLQAPYNLKATTDGSTLKLSWTAGANAPEYSYQHDGDDMVLGMTKSSGTLEGYHAIMFKAADMADKVGQKVARIRFKLADTNLNSASVFVMYGKNIMYEQTVALSSLQKGWNAIVLNEPVLIPAGQDISVGYHITYKNGIKPIVLDTQPAVAGYSDLISGSGSPDYWKSLAIDHKQNYNYRIAAILETTDVTLQPQRVQRAIALPGYNVYCNGKKINTGNVGTTEYSVPNAAYGEYTVTATAMGNESSESNKVVYSETTAVTLPTATTPTDGKVYTIDGQMVSPDTNTSSLQQGVYIRNGKKIVVK